MKKSFLLMLVLLFALFLVACEEPDASAPNSTTTTHVHSFGQWSVSREATCALQGEQTRACACGATESRSVAALPHAFGEWTSVQEANCTQFGKESRSCICGKEETRKIDPADHAYAETERIYPTPSNANGTVKYICTACGDSYETQMDIPGSKGLEYKVITPEIADIPQADGTTCMIVSIGTCTDSDLVIPEYIDGYKVLIIGETAFFDCHSITSVVIPDGVFLIGTATFKNCLSLKSVTLPNSVTMIGEEAFHWCWNLSEITIPDGVCSIGQMAFRGCAITSIVIPDSVVSIGFGAFNACTQLTSVTISNNMAYLSDDVFADCISLTSVTIPESVTEIGSMTFAHCDSLVSISIGKSVKSIKDAAFSYCSHLREIHFAGTIAQWNAIIKGDGRWAGDAWDAYTGYYTVYCTNGEIKK